MTENFYTLIMKLKGIDKFLAKVPDYRGKRVYRIPLIVLLSFIISLVSMILLDLLPRLFPSIPFLVVIEPFMPIISTILFQILGVLLIRRIWTKRNSFLKENYERAYQKSLRYILTGIPFFVATMLHGFFPINLIPPTPNVGSITWFMASPFTELLNIQYDFLEYIRLIIGFIILVLGIGTILRSLFTFGFDYMSVMYIYYPEESEVNHHEIYSIIRHPTYYGIILMSFSSVVFRFSLYSLIICLLFILAMNIHIKWTEDKELIERFGTTYKEYMKTTNALFYPPQYIKKYFMFLLGKNENSNTNH
jgi:protein-S-isoprenylcysteine O-methyltransferase Ste14